MRTGTHQKLIVRTWGRKSVSYRVRTKIKSQSNEQFQRTFPHIKCFSSKMGLNGIYFYSNSVWNYSLRFRNTVQKLHLKLQLKTLEVLPKTLELRWYYCIVVYTILLLIIQTIVGGGQGYIRSCDICSVNSKASRCSLKIDKGLSNQLRRHSGLFPLPLVVNVSKSSYIHTKSKTKINLKTSTNQKHKGSLEMRGNARPVSCSRWMCGSSEQGLQWTEVNRGESSVRPETEIRVVD